MSLSLDGWVIKQGSMTGTAVLTSSPTNINKLSGVGYQFSWTGTPNGSLSFEVSNNYDPQNTTGAVWTVLSTSLIAGYSGISPAGSAGNSYVDLTGLKAKWVRCKYTNSSSTGTLDVYVSGKESGG